MDHEIAACTLCGAAIIWITDQAGTRLPVNKTRVRAYVLGEGARGAFAELDGSDKAVLFHISHFTTCPKVKLVRRLKKRAKR